MPPDDNTEPASLQASRRTVLRSIGALGVLGAVDAERWAGPWNRPFTMLRTPASTRLADVGTAEASESGSGTAAAASGRRTVGDDPELAVKRVPTPTVALSGLVEGRAAAAELDPLAALLAERAGIGTVLAQAADGRIDRGDGQRVESVLATARDDVRGIEDLRDRRVAFGDPLCGIDSLYPLGTIEETLGRGVALDDEFGVRWVDSGSATAVADEVAAIGTTATAADRAGLRPIASAGELPRPVLVAGAAMPRVERERFVEAAGAVASEREGWLSEVRRVDAAALDAVAERATALGVRLDAL
ncbi:PhnD/SsuA/transferrin family substrate-binding protein [Natronoarchaeum mannanilyticum]|uniref:PhnD/SsuA/transferrin family substrate-binding protein n=1 Tax=Natronoarchaeum mannanilyticum TaxID=926360 RepID=UPI0031CF6471